MNTANDITRLVDDLAGHWTDSALDILKAAGIHLVSVDLELATWRSLKQVLQGELRWQRAFRFSTLVSLSTLMEQVLRKATLLVAQQFEPQSVSCEFENRIRRSVDNRRSTAAERRLYEEIVRQPALGAAFKLPGRSDFVPRLRDLAIGG